MCIKFPASDDHTQLFLVFFFTNICRTNHQSSLTLGGENFRVISKHQVLLEKNLF